MEGEKTVLTEPELLTSSIDSYCNNTQKAYLYAYNKLREILNVEEVHKIPNEDIIKKVSENIPNKNTVNQAINMAIKIKRLYDEDDESLVQFRDKELKQAIAASTIAKNTRISPLLPTYSEINAWIDHLYENKEYRKYAINYLLWNLNCRNLDLWARFIRNSKEAVGQHNYLVLKPHSVEFIRRRYKTAASHGEKTNTITNKHFVKSCWELTKGFHRDPLTHPYWLVFQADGDEHSSEEQIGHHVSFNTFEKIGESNYLKIMMQHIDQTGNITRLNHISKNRGTHVNVLLTNYNCKNKAFINLVN
jgi:hypothetical protein